MSSPKQLFLTFCTISQVWVISNFQNASFGREPIRSREEQARPPNWLIKFSILINSRIEGICQVFKLKLNGVITDYIYVGGHILLALPTVNSDQHCVRFGNYFQTRKFQADVQHDHQQLVGFFNSIEMFEATYVYTTKKQILRLSEPLWKYSSFQKMLECRKCCIMAWLANQL